MIKLVCFDLDGVLVDARDMHYEALNRALKSIDETYTISTEEHLSTYDGLPTSKKCQLLTEHKGLPKDAYDLVWKRKQKATRDIILEMNYDNRMRFVLERFKDLGYKICVASNSIRESLKMMLLKKGLLEYVDFYVSNQDVKNPKPNPEMYFQCMIKAEVSAKETLIIEDSHVGRKAALSSGAHLCAVEDPEAVTFERIMSSINDIDKVAKIRPPWQGKDMNVLIPMAGAGTRFVQAGYTFPKPLIEVNGKPMIQLVVENLNLDAKHIFIVQKSHYEEYNLKYLLGLIAPNCEIVQVDGVTEGAACTTLLAKEYIDNDKQLVIANSDQFVEWDSNEFMYSMVGDNIDAGILTFKSTHPKWSFARLDDEGYVAEVAEKKPISDIATVGIYYYAKGSDYVKYAEQMIEKDIRINNEFYVCPVFNEAIGDDKKIKVFNIKKMWGIGDPEGLRRFTENYNEGE
tara:strand:- start:4041 stop:5417 length:1377 start_codon:yes stop_codon:yes gene_type:complete